uniref:CCHC-type domain-containing protein n=1 Tax=Moniliophthora roreri TaxID=221103 RepID=A0A0W0GAT1_MONRR
MSTNSGNIYFLNSHQSAVPEEMQPIIPGMAFSMGVPIPLTNAQVKAAQGQAPSQAATTPVIKQEETVPSLFPKKEEQDSDMYNLGVAATVDAHQCTIRAQTQEIENLKRQMSSLLDALATQKPLSQGTLMFTMNQDVQGKHGQPMIGRAVQSTSAGQICYWCGEQGHMVRECPLHKQMVNDGWLVWNESANHYILKDGKRLPKHEGTEFWKDKVTEYAKTKGWVMSSDSYFFSGIEEEDEPPNVFHAATTTAPVFEENTLQQLAAAMLQQMQLNAAQTDVTKN